MAIEPSIPGFTVRLLGPLEVHISGAPLPPVHARSVLWLLALLILRHPRPLERDWLAGVLWPESTQEQALANLRQRLSQLRRALGEEGKRLLTPTSRTLGLDLEGADIDLFAFDAAMIRSDPAALEQAIALYRGPLLQGCDEEWVVGERQSREQSYLGVLERLAQETRQRDPRAAIGWLRQAVALDPLRESAQRALMQTLADIGEMVEAGQVYRTLREHLYRHLNAEPDPQTTALYHRLRDQRRPPVPATSASMPTAATDASVRSRRASLRHPLTSLIEREREVDDITLCLSASRLVTLIGAGGIGKTRLALAVGHRLTSEFEEGAWFVDLAPLAASDLVAQTVAEVLDLREPAGCSALDRLRDGLRERHLLVLLDNCEHLIDACAGLVSELLSHCPHLRILATSRQALGLTGERLYRVPSLPVPSLSEPQDTGHLSIWAEYGAVRLFVERAQAVHAPFALTVQNAEAVVRLCGRLDGIPLAIELAAARLPTLSVSQILDRLDDRFRLLSLGSRDALPRHRTLQATIDWSYNLLSAQEQALFRRLSIFAGGWTLEAAEQVCSDFGFEILDFGLSVAASDRASCGLKRNDQNECCIRQQTPNETSAIQNPKSKIQNADVLDLLSSLVSKSLVVVEMGDEGVVRYRLLETLCQYGNDRLKEGGEERAVRVRHYDYYVAQAESRELEWCRLEQDNLRAGLAFCLAEPGQAKAALRLVAVVCWYWLMTSAWVEGRTWAAAALRHDDATEGGSRERMEALNVTAHIAWNQGDRLAAQTLAEECLALARRHGDRGLQTSALTVLGTVTADPRQAHAYREEWIAIARETGDAFGLATAIAHYGINLAYQGDLVAARAHLTEAQSLAARHGVQCDDLADYTAYLAFFEGDYEQARPLFEELLAVRRQKSAVGHVPGFLRDLGIIRLRQGDFAAARAQLEEALSLNRQLGNSFGICSCLEGYAALADVEGKPARSARLFGAVERQREILSRPMVPIEHQMLYSSVLGVRAILGAGGFAQAWAEGRAMSLEQIVAYALGEEHHC